MNKVVAGHCLYIFSQECYYIEGRKSVAFPYIVWQSHLKGIVSKFSACVTSTVLIYAGCRMDKYMKGWFIEMNDMWPGQAMALQVDEILHHEKSQYQDILVFNTYVCVCV